MKFLKACLVLHTLIALVGCHGPAFNLPPAEYLMAPGPGVDGPGPGVLTSADYSGMYMGSPPSGMEGAMGDCPPGGLAGPMPTVQVLFVNPAGMHIFWDTTGSGGFDGAPLVSPGRTNFDQAGLYRCKLTNVPGHEGVELYPTIEIGTPTPNTVAFISHNAIPIQLTPDDFNQVTAGNFVTKVIYLPDPDFQHLAVAGVETLVSTRLDPGIDPVVEADRRGSILGIIRIGNKDIEMPGTQFNEVYSATLDAQGQVAQVGHMQDDGSSGGGCGCGAHGGSGSFQGSPRVPLPIHQGAALAGMPLGSTPLPGGMMGPPGARSPTYGMPMTGTPIGLPGPPHIPLGGPAGLRKHIIHNHTATYIPEPSKAVKIHVKQHPGVSYPAPRTHAWINQYDHPNCAHVIKSGP